MTAAHKIKNRPALKMGGSLYVTGDDPGDFQFRYETAAGIYLQTTSYTTNPSEKE